MAETPVIGFDPSTANVFKKKVAFDIGWDELEGKKTNPHIDVPEFSIGGLGFQLKVQPQEDKEGYPYAIWLHMVETSQKIALPDFDIRFFFTYSSVNWAGGTISDVNRNEVPLSANGRRLISFAVESHMEIDMEMTFLAVYSYRLQFLVADVATKNDNDCKIVLKDDEDKIVYVNKNILAHHSPFFRTLFFGDFQEKNEDVIKLSDVKQEDFFEYLCSVYPPSNPPFTFKTIETLLILADRFQNDILKWRIQNFLMEKKDKTPEEARQTLILADDYDMTKVFRSTLKTMDKKNLKMLKPKTFKNFERENLELYVTHMYGLM